MILLGAAVGFVVTLLLCPLVIRELGRRTVLDTPVERSSHSVPTLRGGGLAPAIGACAGAVVASGSSSALLLVVAGVAAAFGTLGLMDDLATVAARRRLLVQLLIAGVAVLPLASGVTSGAALVLLTPVAWIWLVAYVNAFNFMDGINGISAAQAVVAGTAWALVGVWQDEPVVAAGGLVIAAAALAFLPYNFPRAKVFLGDVGSYFLGGWLAAMVVVALGHGLTPEMAVAPVLLYLAETGTTLLRRIARRAPLSEAHREHTYQQLVAGGWSHARTTGFVAAVITLSSLLGAATLAGDLALRAGADVALVLLMVGYLMSPQWQSRRNRLEAAPASQRDRS